MHNYLLGIGNKVLHVPIPTAMQSSHFVAIVASNLPVTSEKNPQHLTLKLLPRGADTRDDVGHVAEHRGEQQEAEQQLEDDEQVLALAAGPWEVADRGEGEGAPVVALQVLLDHVRTLGVHKHPVLAAEPVVLAYDVEQTPVPVEDDEEVVDQTGRTEQVRVIGVSLRPVHERPEPIRCKM